ncbi:MAG: HAMP domain-containing histidine kinase, partial [Lachnospiraceae bacterium]|nr:HAMP domain-containing histidine kinase [Lachnospiraceae bacterium]
SIQWLERIEAQNGFTIYVIDNGTPFLYNSLRRQNDSTSQSLLEESLEAYQSMFQSSLTETDNEAIYSIVFNNNSNESYFVTLTTSYAYYGIRHHEYQFRSPSTGQSYYASIVDIEKDSARTQIVILYALTSLNAQIFRQRLRFLLIDLAAAAMLLAFSFFFTGRILKPLRDNQEAQMQFFAAASHELRTPLSVMLASAECCEEATADEQKSFFKTIRKEGRRMSSLLGDMLTLAHAGTNRFPIEKAPAQLDTLCLNAYEAFDSLCRGKSLSLTLKLPDDIPPRCFCDAERIAQTLSILLHNAVSYTPEGGNITLMLKYRESSFHRFNNNCFLIIVADTGTGISDADKKHIFERFYRTEKSRSTKEHFGLGLSIAYEIVSAHHGKITVEDNPGGGSIFTIILPESSKAQA